MNESLVQTQGTPSFKVNLHVELGETTTEKGFYDEGDGSRPYSENSWKEQFLRLVREAPYPDPVVCSEPRRFPHFGRRQSDSSWTSDTTRVTGVSSPSRPNSSELEDGFKSEKQTEHDNNKGNLHVSPAKCSTAPGMMIVGSIGSDPGSSDRSKSYDDVHNSNTTRRSSKNGKTLELKCNPTEKGKECERKEGEMPSLSSSSSPMPQGNSAAGGKVKINEESHHLQEDNIRKDGAASLRNWGMYEDPKYWEKFRHSKDYQSSLMIETICNEVFNLMPSSRYKSLMKLSRESNVKKIELETECGKGESPQRRENIGSVCINNDSSVAEDSHVEKVEHDDDADNDGETKEKGERCSVLLSPSNDDDDHNGDRDENQEDIVPGQGNTIISKDDEVRDSENLRVEEAPDEPEPPLLEKHCDRKKSYASTVSSVWTTTTTEDGRETCDDKMRAERMLMLKGFGQTFHGYLTKWETEDLLRNKGQYLIRQLWKEDGFILSFRFDEEVRNYRILCNVTFPSPPNEIVDPGNDSCGSNVVYTYCLEPRHRIYNSLDELVREGLMTLHLDENAGSYIDLLMELAQHQKIDNFLQTPPVMTPGSRKNSRSASFLRLARLNSSSSAGGGGCRRSVGVDAYDDKSNSISLSVPSNSSLKRDSMNIALLIHFFEEEIFDGLAKCQVCSHGLWGSSNKGLRCRDCRLAVHESCIDNVKCQCSPNLTSISPFSPTDLTTLVKGSLSTTEDSALAYGPPYILEKCVKEVEARGGLVTEGIYRISGSVDEIDCLKNLFEKERINANLSDCPDIHSITGLIKFFLRQLPDSLITQEVFEEFIREGAGEITIEIVQMLVSCLPPAHRITLKYLLDHLSRVTKERGSNKMGAFNISSVMMPSIVRPPNMFEFLESSTKLVHLLIVHVDDLQF